MSTAKAFEQTDSVGSTSGGATGVPPEHEGTPLADPLATPTPAPAAIVPRDPSGKFIKGYSGNPVGRPHGRPNDTTIAASARMKSHVDEMVSKALDMVRDPDTNDAVRAGLIRMMIDRTLISADQEAAIRQQAGNVANVGDLIRALDDEELAIVEEIFERARQRLADGWNASEMPVPADATTPESPNVDAEIPAPTPTPESDELTYEELEAMDLSEPEETK